VLHNDGMLHCNTRKARVRPFKQAASAPAVALLSAGELAPSLERRQPAIPPVPCAPAAPKKIATAAPPACLLALRPLLLLLPLLLRASLPRLLFHVCQWPRMLHACELVLLVVAMGGRRRLVWVGLR